MKTGNNFRTLAGVVFMLVSIMHLWVALSGASFALNDVIIGSWVNWLAFVVTGYMGLVAFHVLK